MRVRQKRLLGEKKYSVKKTSDLNFDVLGGFAPAAGGARGGLHFTLKGFTKEKINLLLFPHHLDRFLRALVGTDTAALAEIQVDIQIIIDNRIGTVGGTEPAGVAFLLIHHRPENPPGPGLTGRALSRPAHRKAFTFRCAAHALISL
jgi:hypothetical protein